MSTSTTESNRAIESNAERITSGVIRTVGGLGFCWHIANFLASMLMIVCGVVPLEGIGAMMTDGKGMIILAVFLSTLIWCIAFGAVFFLAPMLSRLYWRGLSLPKA